METSASFEARSAPSSYSTVARLGWLLDPIANRVDIYRPGEPVQEIERPEIISGDPVLPGFSFDFREIL